MEESREADVVAYFFKKLGSADIVPLDELWSEVDEAPRHLKRYMRRKYGNVEQFEIFLQKNPRTFFVENRMVTRCTSELENGRRDAVEYFKEVLESYEEAPNYLNFRGHVGQASDDVIDFINDFYSGTSFKDFLQSRPDVFVVFDDDTVWLIEDEAVDYFKDILTEFGDDETGVHYRSLWGHIGQAERYVREFINTQYPGDDFMDFLLENDDVFEMHGEYVFLS